MFAFRLRTAAVAVAATLGLSACTMPYGGVGIGSGGGYYGSQYGYGYGGGYPAYGYGYGNTGYAPYYGWYDDYYYPGTGYYVYDRYRQPYRWTDDQRRYWEDRRERAISSKEFRQRMEQTVQQQNWSGFEQAPVSSQRIQRRGGRSMQVDRSDRVSRSERSVSRAQRGESSRRQSSSDFRRSMEERARADNGGESEN